MPYEIVAEKVKALPARAVEEVMHYVDCITTVYVSSPKEKKDTSFIDDMQGILSHEDVGAIRSTCHMRFNEA